jgi:hypothetical protein
MPPNGGLGPAPHRATKLRRGSVPQRSVLCFDERLFQAPINCYARGMLSALSYWQFAQQLCASIGLMRRTLLLH